MRSSLSLLNKTIARVYTPFFFFHRIFFFFFRFFTDDPCPMVGHRSPSIHRRRTIYPPPASRIDYKESRKDRRL